MAVVDTPFHDRRHLPEGAISAEKAVSAMLKGIEKSKNEIRIGEIKLLCLLHRIAPDSALNLVNKL